MRQHMVRKMNGNTLKNECEIFLLASYSCLPDVIVRLENLVVGNQKAQVFCLSQQLYQFLKPLAADYPCINIHHVDLSLINTLRLRSPLNWWKARQHVAELCKRWFAPVSCRGPVHFYNRHAALFLLYAVWQLKAMHPIHYTECDPVDLYTRDRSLPGWLQKLIFRCVYPIPFEMVSIPGKRRRRLPSANAHFMEQVIAITHPRTLLPEAKKTELYQRLCWQSSARVLWIMGMVLDMNEVFTTAYCELLKQCIDAVNSVCTPAQQAVKFHPRAQKRETVWSPDIEYVSGHIPAEFIDLPELEIVLTISSTAVSMLGVASNIKVISLVELIPFRDERIRDTHRRSARHFGSETTLFMPASIAEFEKCLSDIREFAKVSA